MSNKNLKNISLIIILALSFVVGVAGGFGALNYINLPLSEDVTVDSEIYHSHSTENTAVDISSSEVSIHFLELGNKYTGDCTYIKVGENIDILIDCGSKSNSIPYVTNYINNYVKDNKLEYVIVTHAHQDHYAGFATTNNVDSIFDLYTCENIITFSKTNQKSTSTLYNNFLRELGDEIDKGANHYSALDCINNTNGATDVIALTPGVTLTILNNYYYDHNSSSENNYSVCCMLTHNGKNFLFTGDLEAEGEEYLVALNSLPEVELYKAGHHGSKTSSTTTLLNVVRPKNVCVCCCAGSPEYTKTASNQFPTQIFIDNVAPYTQNVYVTTLCVDYENNIFTSFNGNIVCFSTGLDFLVSCSNNNTVLKDSTWFKSNRTLPNAWK